MSEFKVKPGTVRSAAGQNEQIARELEQISSGVYGVRRRLRFQIAQRDRINQRLDAVAKKISEEGSSAKRTASVLKNVASQYENTELGLCGEKKSSENSIAVISNAKVYKASTFVDEFKSKYGFKEVLKGAGYISTVYSILDGATSATSSKDYFKAGKDTFDFVNKAIKEYANYKKIGNAVGAKTAKNWWFKHITGLTSLRNVSKAKNPTTRFINNLKNKTSPYNIQFKKAIGNYVGKGGVKAAVASWAGVLLSGASNYILNREEQKTSNGTMSDARVWEETVTETIVDTGLSLASQIVVGAAISALLPAAAPGVLVVALTGLVSAGIGAGVKAITGKSVTEWLSDKILDHVEKKASEIGSQINKVKNSVNSWFNKLSFA